MKILITGATGLIGRKLLIDLQKLGHTVSGVSRDPQNLIEIPQELAFRWDALSDDEFPIAALKGCEAVIHLAGYPIADKRWSQEIKKKILDSRVRGTQQLVKAFSQLKNEERPQVFVSASAVGFYGDRRSEELTENSTSGNDFLADVVKQWEAAATPTQALGIRTILARSGVVLSRSGGALDKMPAVKLGSGKNYMSWIHLQDWVNFIIKALNDNKIRGIYNLVAPEPVTQAEFVKSLAQAKKIPLVLWTPTTIFKTALGQMSEMLLASQKIKPGRMQESGYQFLFPTLDSALKDIYQDEDYLTQDYRAAQFVPQKLDTVFKFFSQAENLEKLTPGFLNFKIQKISTPEIQKGTIIDYKLKIHGVPVSWQTEIIEWEPKRKFIDFQNHGPYSLWHHTHTFTTVQGGTLIEDRIKYKVPGHLLGLLGSGWMIKKDVRNIFKFRAETTNRLLSKV